jgi:hypothetical protein
MHRIRASLQQEWKNRLTRFLLETLRVTGFQESKRSGVWKRERKEFWEYDPKTDRLYVIRESLNVMRCNCTRAQLKSFQEQGEMLLVEMGRVMNQEAVAYETREGLTILSL